MDFSSKKGRTRRPCSTCAAWVMEIRAKDPAIDGISKSDQRGKVFGTKTLEFIRFTCPDFLHPQWI